MDDARLETLISQVRARLEAIPPAQPLWDQSCLTFVRARALALDPEQWTAGERQHANSCNRCRHLVESFHREIGHLSYWILLRDARGVAREWEQQQVDAHLEMDGCRYCRRRKEALAQRLSLWLHFPHVPALRDPATLLAAPAEPLVLARAEHADLEAELIDDRDDLSLEIRTKNPALDHKLVGYAFIATGGELVFEGFLLLVPDVEGWYTGQAALERAAFLGRSGRPGGTLEVSVPELELLGERETPLLRAAAARDETGRQAWLSWAERAAVRFADSPIPIAATLRAIAAVLRSPD